MSGERPDPNEEERPELVSPDEGVAGAPADLESSPQPAGDWQASAGIERQDLVGDDPEIGSGPVAESPDHAEDPDHPGEAEGEDEQADRATSPFEEPARVADDDAVGADPDDPDPLPGTGASAAGEPETDDAAPVADRPAVPATPRPRRGAAEVGAAPRAQPRRPREPVGDIEVRAQARYVRTAPRKARLVVDHIRGKTVDEAIAILTHTPRAAAEDVLKLLRSCVANAENNHELDPEDLRIGRAYVDEGPTLKRYRPRAQGRATRIRKRTSHMTITLIPKE